MPTKRAARAAPEVSARSVRRQLDRILNGRTFQPVARLQRFLSFIVAEALEGRGDQLKEYVVAVHVFDKEDAFDPRTDPLVRVQARRLRSRLVRYYHDEGQLDDVLIDLPKGGYVPTFRTREQSAPAPKRSVTAMFAVENSIGVRRFSDESAEQNLVHFCNGLRDEILHHLSLLEGLRVLASEPNDSHGSPSRTQPLQPALVVTGSVRSAGDRLRITAQLVDAVGNQYLWSESVDGLSGDALGAQEETARAVAERIRRELPGSASASWSRTRAENLHARNLYLQGRHHLNQRTEESLKKALEFFEKAVAEDPQYALAHAGLADAYRLLGHYAVLPPSEVLTRSASSAATAVMLDGNSAEARTSLAHVKSTQHWDWLGGEREYRRAISLDPRYPTAHHWYAVSCLVPMRRLDEALEEMQVAEALDPVSCIIARDLAMIHYYRQDLDAALDQCDHTIELNPHFSPAYWLLGFIQEQRGDLDESIAAFQRALNLSPQSEHMVSVRMQSALARAMALYGKRQVSLQMLKALEELSQRRYVSPFEFAAIHFALARRDSGFEWLSKATDDRSFEMTAIEFDPRVQTVRDDARFKALVQRLGLDAFTAPR